MENNEDNTGGAPATDVAPEVAPEGEVPMPPAEVPPETAAPADTPPPPPKHSEAFRSRIKNSHPDIDENDDESFYQKANEELDNLESYRNKNMEANEALVKIFDAEPQILEVIKDMVAGASFREALSRHFSPDELTPQEGDPDHEGWKKNSEARDKKRSDMEAYEKTKAENSEFSTKEIQAFAKENNLSDEDAEKFLNDVGSALDDIYQGKITKSFLNSMFKALNHEKDVKVAEATGEIKGKNEKIEVQKEQAKKPKGDGLPALGGGEKSSNAEPKKKNWVEETIENEKRRQIL
jgi:hypothetical protein